MAAMNRNVRNRRAAAGLAHERLDGDDDGRRAKERTEERWKRWTEKELEKSEKTSGETKETVEPTVEYDLKPEEDGRKNEKSKGFVASM